MNKESNASSNYICNRREDAASVAKAFAALLQLFLETPKQRELKNGNQEQMSPTLTPIGSKHGEPACINEQSSWLSNSTSKQRRPTSQLRLTMKQ